MQIGERLRAELDPDQFDQFGIRMHHALDAVRDGRCVRREEAGVEAPDAARRGDRTRNQEQPGRIGQQPCLGKWFPGSVQIGFPVLVLAAQAKAGFLAGFADCGDGE